MVCVGLSERDLLQWHDVMWKILGGTLEVQAKFWGGSRPLCIPLAPPLPKPNTLNLKPQTQTRNLNLNS